MLYYLLAFSLSLYATHIASHSKARIQFYVISFFAILPPVFLAGFRDVSVGSDTSFYIEGVFEDAVSVKSDLEGLIYLRPTLEVPYLWINCLIARFSNSLTTMLLFNHSLVMIPLYIAAMKWKKMLSPVFFLFVFYFTCYNETLSTIRQAISISFSILAFTEFVIGKKRWFLLNSFITLLFHNTAFIPLTFPLLYILVQHFPIKKYKFNYIIVGIIVVNILYFISGLVIWLINIGVISARYIAYTAFSDVFEAELGLSNFVIKIFILLCVYYFYRINSSKSLIDVFLIFAFLDLGFSLCGLIINHLIRLSLYPRAMVCISMPFLLHTIPCVIRSKYGIYITLKGCFILFLFAYWLWVIILGDFAATSNYMFDFKR